MNDAEFHAEVDALFLMIEESLEKDNPEIDFESHNGLLTLLLPQGDHVVLSRQVTLGEIWLASRKGAYHFQKVASGWVTRKGEVLLPLLSEILKEG